MQKAWSKYSMFFCVFNLVMSSCSSSYIFAKSIDEIFSTEASCSSVVADTFCAQAASYSTTARPSLVVIFIDCNVRSVSLWIKAGRLVCSTMVLITSLIWLILAECSLILEKQLRIRWHFRWLISVIWLLFQEALFRCLKPLLYSALGYSYEFAPNYLIGRRRSL